MIEFKNVTLYLNERKVLDDLSFTIADGEILLLVGGSGSGKSTILKLIMGLWRPDSGEILIDGQDITKMSEKELLKVRRHFGIVFQDGALFDSLTVEENVGFYLREALKMPEEEVRKLVCEELGVLGLRPFLNYYPAELSGGMRKRVAIARAAIKHPHCLLYDEPTAGLDPISAQRVVDMIEDLYKQNVTSVIVTHEIHYFSKLVKRVLLLRNGKIVYDGEPVSDIHSWYGFDEEVEFQKEDCD
jgi:phospholipid/cholesterol/gamma-HCH transport system ATP-binding protein